MAPRSVELILVRHLASRLAVPVFVIDPAGDLVFFNEPAEALLGWRYEEVRVMPIEEWASAFAPSLDGRPLEAEELPLVVALRRGAPGHGRLEIVSSDGQRRTIEVTAFPIIAPGSQLRGAVAMFWEPADQ